MYKNKINIRDVLDDLVYNRIVRRLSVQGETFFELTHEYLVETVSEWVSEEEHEQRSARALLDHEMEIAQLYGSLIPLSRAELIQKYSTKIQMSKEEISLVNKSIERGYDEINEREKLEDQLRRAQKMEAIGTLAGGIAHDFNNILASIFGYAELLKMDLSEQENSGAIQNRYIDPILTSANRAKELVIALLSFSRGGQQPQLNSIDLNELVLKLVKFISRTFGPEYEIQVANETDLWLIMADSGKIEQLAMNLCTNAKDSMPSGGTIRISTHNYIVKNDIEGIKAGRYVTLIVVDTGIGISEEDQNRIFEPFYTTKEPGKGTGLGLAVTYGIVKSLGGEIKVESEIGKGSTFKVYLPSTATSAKSKAEIIERGTPVLGRGQTILLVDDEALIVDITKRMLEKLGYEVVTASDGIEAINMLEKYKNAIKLVFMDLEMPKISGHEAAKRIIQKYSGMRFIFSTGRALEDAKAQSGIANVEGILQKPYSFLEIKHALSGVRYAKPALEKEKR